MDHTRLLVTASPRLPFSPSRLVPPLTAMTAIQNPVPGVTTMTAILSLPHHVGTPLRPGEGPGVRSDQPAHTLAASCVASGDSDDSKLYADDKSDKRIEAGDKSDKKLECR